MPPLHHSANCLCWRDSNPWSLAQEADTWSIRPLGLVYRSGKPQSLNNALGFIHPFLKLSSAVFDLLSTWVVHWNTLLSLKDDVFYLIAFTLPVMPSTLDFVLNHVNWIMWTYFFSPIIMAGFDLKFSIKMKVFHCQFNISFQTDLLLSAVTEEEKIVLLVYFWATTRPSVLPC